MQKNLSNIGMPILSYTFINLNNHKMLVVASISPSTLDMFWFFQEFLPMLSYLIVFIFPQSLVLIDLMLDDGKNKITVVRTWKPAESDKHNNARILKVAHSKVFVCVVQLESNGNG